MIKVKTKSYQELIRLSTFDERKEYLYIGDMIGHKTFGSSRYLNQQFYKSPEWRHIRDNIIIRDGGCDLGVDGCGLSNKNILVHHINPITEDDIINRNPCLFDEDNLISSSLITHNFIHFGTSCQETYFERTPNDTCPWKNGRR